MVDSKELALAFEKAKIRSAPFEEHLFMYALLELEKKILKSLDGSDEVRSPYEFN